MQKVSDIKRNDFRYEELCRSCEEAESENTFRSNQFYEDGCRLRDDWDQNNILYNSLKFYQICRGHVEQSKLIENKILYKNDKWMIGGIKWHRDVMTSWWTPAKYFLFKTNKGCRDELSIKLLGKISQENDISKLTKELSLIRTGKDNCVNIDVIVAFMNFLKVIYWKGNFTCGAVKPSGGALDNWDAKLKNIKKEYLDSNKWSQNQWRNYIEGNAFQCYFEDKDYAKIKPFWEYGSSKLAEATDKDWKEYFENVESRIEKRNIELNDSNSDI